MPILWWLDHTEFGTDLAHLLHISIGHVGWKRRDAVAHTGSKETVHLGAVDPGKEVGVGGCIRRTVGRRTDDVFVHSTHHRHRLIGVGSGSERGDPEERPRALKAPQRIGPVRGVLGHSCECRRMQGLKQQCSEPPDQHGDVAVDRPHRRC